MTINERVGNNIRKYRIAHHYTLKDLSALVHKSCSTLSKYEKGILPVSVETLEEFGEVFHIPTSHLLSALSEEKPESRHVLPVVHPACLCPYRRHW